MAVNFQVPSTPLDLSALAGDSFLFEGANGAKLYANVPVADAYGEDWGSYNNQIGFGLNEDNFGGFDKIDDYTLGTGLSFVTGTYSIDGQYAWLNLGNDGLSSRLDVRNGDGTYSGVAMTGEEAALSWDDPGVWSASVNVNFLNAHVIATDEVTGDEGALTLASTSASLIVGDGAGGAGARLFVTDERVLLQGPGDSEIGPGLIVSGTVANDDAEIHGFCYDSLSNLGNLSIIPTSALLSVGDGAGGTGPCLTLDGAGLMLFLQVPETGATEDYSSILLIPTNANMAAFEYATGLSTGLDISVSNGRTKVFYDPLGNDESNYLSVGEASVELVSTDIVTEDAASLNVEPLVFWVEINGDEVLSAVYDTDHVELAFYGATPVAKQSLATSPTAAQIATVLSNLGLVTLT